MNDDSRRFRWCSRHRHVQPLRRRSENDGGEHCGEHCSRRGLPCGFLGKRPGDNRVLPGFQQVALPECRSSPSALPARSWLGQHTFPRTTQTPPAHLRLEGGAPGQVLFLGPPPPTPRNCGQQRASLRKRRCAPLGTVAGGAPRTKQLPEVRGVLELPCYGPKDKQARVLSPGIPQLPSCSNTIVLDLPDGEVASASANHHVRLSAALAVLNASELLAEISAENPLNIAANNSAEASGMQAPFSQGSP